MQSIVACWSQVKEKGKNKLQMVCGVAGRSGLTFGVAPAGFRGPGSASATRKTRQGTDRDWDKMEVTRPRKSTANEPGSSNGAQLGRNGAELCLCWLPCNAIASWDESGTWVLLVSVSALRGWRAENREASQLGDFVWSFTCLAGNRWPVFG